MSDELRERFETWISSPPYERVTTRFPSDDPVWPDQYRDINVDLAWRAWQEGHYLAAERDGDEPVTVDAEWTDDCQGKKDFDGSIVTFDSRYWPRGGGFTVMHRGPHGVSIEDNEARPEIKPSATSHIRFCDREIATKDFQAETEGEVKAAVESWVNEQANAIRKALGIEAKGA